MLYIVRPLKNESRNGYLSFQPLLIGCQNLHQKFELLRLLSVLLWVQGLQSLVVT